MSPESIKIEGKIGARLNALCYVWGHKDKGKFRGLVISEVALFRLSKSAFEFDPMFSVNHFFFQRQLKLSFLQPG